MRILNRFKQPLEINRLNPENVKQMHLFMRLKIPIFQKKNLLNLLTEFFEEIINQSNMSHGALSRGYFSHMVTVRTGSFLQICYVFTFERRDSIIIFLMFLISGKNRGLLFS